jgi:RNA polymerase sigma factor, sigma-70 family
LEEGTRKPDSADEHGSFDDFVREYRRPLASFMVKRGASMDEANDLVQETMMKLMRYRDQSADVWRILLYRIAINAFNDHLRRRRTDPVHGAVAMDDIELPSHDLSHEHRIAVERELQLVRRGVAALPKRCRQVYLLNRIDGLSYSQIARHCGISVKAVEKSMTRALGLLREHVQRDSPQGKEKP